MIVYVMADSLNFLNSFTQNCMFIWGCRVRQHLRSLAPAMNDFGWLWWPVESGAGWGLRFPDIYLTVEEKPINLENWPDRGSNPCYIVMWEQRCYPLTTAVEVDRSTAVSCGCVSTGNDPRPRRPRASTDERSVELLADALEGNRRATCEELSRATGTKTSQKNAQQPTSVARGWATRSPW